MLKTASRLGYRVGQNARKNDPQIDNRSDKLACKINVKQSLTFFKLSTRMVFSNTMFCSLTA